MEFSRSTFAPLCNEDAERAVLGSSLLDKEALNIVVEMLSPEDFYVPTHVTALQVMKGMVERGKAVDLITFTNEYTKLNSFKDFDIDAFTASLVDAVTTTANVEHYCAIVRDKAARRGLVKVGSEIGKIAYDDVNETDEILTNAEQMVFELARKGNALHIEKLHDVISRNFEVMERTLSGNVDPTGIPSGFTDLDKLTNGFQPGSLNIIAARPSVGKTAFALNIARNIAVREKIPVLIYSLEMPSEQLCDRLLASQAGVNLRNLYFSGKVTDMQWKMIIDAAGDLSDSPIYIDDSSSLNTIELRSRCRRFLAKEKLDRCMIVIDYLQLMRSSKKCDNEQQEISDISRSLKGIAREFSVPVIALSQLSRQIEQRGKDEKRPQLSDLRGSGSIEQDADLVAFLRRVGLGDSGLPSKQQQIELFVAKHRNGPTGVVPLNFDTEVSTFTGSSFRPENM